MALDPLSALTTTLNSLGDWISENQQIKAAKEMNEQNIEFQRELNEEIFEREDTAYQRAVADATAAGFSPLAVTGGAGSGGTVSAPQNTFDYSQYAGAGARAAGQALQQAYMQSLQIEQMAANVEKTYAEADAARETVDSGEHYRTVEFPARLQQQYDQMSTEARIEMRKIQVTEAGQALQKTLQQMQHSHEEVMQSSKFRHEFDFEKQRFLNQSTLSATERRFQDYMERQKQEVAKDLARLTSDLRKSEDEASQELAHMLWTMREEYLAGRVTWKDVRDTLFGAVSAAGDLLHGGAAASNADTNRKSHNPTPTRPIGFGK